VVAGAMNLVAGTTPPRDLLGFFQDHWRSENSVH